MTHKRRLDLAFPEQGGAATAASPSPRKRLWRTVLVMMWLRRRRAAAAAGLTGDQVVVLVRQMQIEVARLFLILMALVLRLGAVENALLELPRTLDRLMGERLDAFMRSFKGVIGDMRHDPTELIPSSAHIEIQEQQAASPSTAAHPSSRQNTSEGFLETKGRTRMLKLHFVDNGIPNDPVFACTPVEWQNGATPKVAIFENGNQITQGVLSELQIEIIPVRDDFFTKYGHVDFSKEEFNRHIYTYRGEQIVLSTIKLTNGEACLSPIFFEKSSYGEKIRLAARVKDQDLIVRVQEAITSSFAVQVNRNKHNGKKFPPSKEDDLHCLKNISKNGKYWKALVGKGITKVKDLMRHHYIDEFALKKFTGMKTEDWNTMIRHAITCDPGKEIYSYSIAEQTFLLFNDFFDLIGVQSGYSYILYENLNQIQKHDVNNLKKFAHMKFVEQEKSGSLIPDYDMINGLLISNNDTTPPIQARQTWLQGSDDQTANQEFDNQQIQQQNGFLSVQVFQTNHTDLSTQPTLPLQQCPFNQNMHLGFSQQSPSMQQDGSSCYMFPGNITNVQGSGSEQFISSRDTAPVQQNGLNAGANVGSQCNRYLSYSAADVPSTSRITDGIVPQTSLHENAQSDILLDLPLSEFEECAALYDRLVADEELLPANNAELANSNYQFDGNGHDDGNGDSFPKM